MGIFHSKDKESKRVKKYLLNNQYYKLSDDDLLWTYYLLKPDLSINSLLPTSNIFYNQGQPSREEIFIGLDKKYLSKKYPYAITPYKLDEIYRGILFEMNRRKISL